MCVEVYQFHRSILSEVDRVDAAFDLRPVIQVGRQVDPQVERLAAQDDPLEDGLQRVEIVDGVPPAVMQLGRREMLRLVDDIRLAQVREVLIEYLAGTPYLVARGRARVG